MSEPRPHRLPDTFVHLGEDGAAVPLEVNESFWADLASGKLGVGKGRLVSCYRFTEPWDSWEVHPAGDELVCLVSGSMEFLLELPEGVRTVALSGPGAFVLVPRGTWHTARPLEPSTAIFVTAGEGTQHRPAAPDA